MHLPPSPPSGSHAQNLSNVVRFASTLAVLEKDDASELHVRRVSMPCTVNAARALAMRRQSATVAASAHHSPSEMGSHSSHVWKSAGGMEALKAKARAVKEDTETYVTDTLNGYGIDADVREGVRDQMTMDNLMLVVIALVFLYFMLLPEKD